MILKLQNAIVNKMLCEDAAEDEKELYSYGVRLVMEQAVNVASAFILMLVFNELLFGIVYLAAFFAIRQYAGGYHASTFLRCYAVSMSSIAAALFIGSLLGNTALEAVYIPISLLCLTIIFILAPVDNKNKELSEQEIIIYRKKCRVILCLAFLALLVFTFTGIHFLALAITIAFFTAAVLFSLGKLLR